MRLLLGVWCCCLLGCSSAPPAPVEPTTGSGDVGSATATPSATPPSPPLAPTQVPTAPPQSACATATVERVQVRASASSTASTGLAIRHRGTSHDSFDDGRTDVMISLTFERDGASASWMPSILALPAQTQLLGHCVRLVEASEERAVLDVGRVPSPASP